MDAEKEERFRCGVKNYSETAFCVNALKGAAFISTIGTRWGVVYRCQRVNALKGATFISTKENGGRLNALKDVSMP